MRFSWLLLLTSCASPPPTTLGPAEIASDEYELAKILFRDGGAPPGSMDVLETLVAPVSVRGWTRDALLLADGRELPLPGDLHRNSILLAEVTRQGIEILNGRPIGLIRVWHWCGNDPIGRHVARVDLMDLLLYLAEEVEDDHVRVPKGFDLAFGWDTSEFRAFRAHQRLGSAAGWSHPPRYLIRNETEALVVFHDRGTVRAEGRLDLRSHTKVSRGRLPDELWDHLEELLRRVAMDNELRAPPYNIDGEFAEFVFDVLRRH